MATVEGFIFLEGRMVEWREKERKGFGDGGGAPPQESAVASGEDGEVGGRPGGTVHYKDQNCNLK